MFYAIIDTESLKNPRILNTYKPFKVLIEYEPNSEANSSHHIFFLLINATDINKLIHEMKEGWFALFWDQKLLYIAFNKIKFALKLPNPQNSKEYKLAQQYGKSVGIQDEFLNFLRYFNRYKKLIPIH